MSKPLVDAASDEEFQDALSDVASNDKVEVTSKEKSNEELIEEILNTKLEPRAKDDNEQPEVFEDVESGPTTDANEEPKEEEEEEVYDDEINEEALREAEKSLTTEQLESNKEKANKLKLEGNELFKNDEAVEAIKTYTEALKICPTLYPKERAILYGNRAAAKIKLDGIEAAIDDCTQAIELWPDYVRARIRRAKLYEGQDKLDKALEDYKHVHELDPGHPDARSACIRLPPIVHERNEKLKEEMMGKFKDLGNMFLKPFGLSTSNFQMQQDPNTGSYSINFNQNK